MRKRGRQKGRESILRNTPKSVDVQRDRVDRLTSAADWHLSIMAGWKSLAQGNFLDLSMRMQMACLPHSPSFLPLYHLELWLVVAGEREGGGERGREREREKEKCGRRRKGGRKSEGGRKKRRKGVIEVQHATNEPSPPSLFSQVTQQCT